MTRPTPGSTVAGPAAGWADLASLDTDPHPVFTTYSAGNFAEVAPDRLSPMSWSLVGPPVERGMRNVAGRLFPRARWATGSHFVFVGYFSCRPYHNLSGFCQLAYGVPGLDPALVTRSYFEDAPVPEPPGGRPYRGGAAVLPQLARELLLTRRRVGALTEQVPQLEAALAEARPGRKGAPGLPAGGGSLALGRLLPGAVRLLDRVWETHYASTMLILPLLAVQDGVARRFVPYWRELEPLVNRPDSLVWQRLADLGAAVPEATSFLHRQFYEVADDQEPWDRYVGALGPPVAGAETDGLLPEDPWALVPLSRTLQLPRLSAVVRIAMEQREHTKSLAMRTLHVMRLVVRAVAARRGLADGDWPYLSLNELLDESMPAAQLHRYARSRAEECAQAIDRPMPDLFNTAQDGPGTGAPEPASTRAGVGICPGQVTGTVVVPGADGRYEPGPDANGGRRILVCERADVQIQTVLPHIDALVTARGSALSHVAILLREHGLPSVIGHPLARDLRPGQEVYVDGTTGEVRLLA
ncbi:MAG TPA: PEP-utilizing enzyme [Micromonosporaceae bacterium]|nr:PEP-utilizing enzyme [Micromonosporaceae bacterium]